MYCRIIILSSLVLVILLDVGMFTLIEISYYSNETILQEYHKFVVDKFYKRRANWTASVLGSILFKNKNIPPVPRVIQNKTFSIVIWKHWYYFKRRYNIRDYGKKRLVPKHPDRAELLKDCSVRNCHFHDRFNSRQADAVIVHLRHGLVPKVSSRDRNQKWIFYTDEPPNLTFSTEVNLTKFDNIFNWSMTYRSDSDIPIPNGRTVPLEKPKPITSLESVSKLVPHWDQKSKKALVAVIMKDCSNKVSLFFIEHLKKYVTIHFYGPCGDKNLRNRCTGTYFESDCKFLRYYPFYLVLEKSLCRQYLTEKVFHNAYSKGAIPIIVGPPESDCYKLLPPHSYLHVSNFNTIFELAQKIRHIGENDERLSSYHVWRAHFEVTDESGYFGVKATALCRVCEALNYNSLSETVYSNDDLNLFLEPNLLCDSEYTIIKRKPVIPSTTPRWCYKLGFENCVEL